MLRTRIHIPFCVFVIYRAQGVTNSRQFVHFLTCRGLVQVNIKLKKNGQMVQRFTCFYDSVPHKIVYFLWPQFGFELGCLLRRGSVLCPVMAPHIATLNNCSGLRYETYCFGTSSWKNGHIRCFCCLLFSL